MKKEDSTWCDSDDSSTSIERDDSDDDSIDMSTAQEISVSKMSLLPQQKRRKRDISQTPRRASSPSEGNNFDPSSQRSQNESGTSLFSSPLRKMPSSFCKSQSKPDSRSLRKRRLPRKSNGCEHPCDTSSCSSGSDDSFFRNSLSLTTLTKTTRKKLDTSSGARGISRRKNAERRSSPENKHALDIQLDRGTSAGGDSSDSDDTAELLERLTTGQSSSSRSKLKDSLPLSYNIDIRAKNLPPDGTNTRDSSDKNCNREKGKLTTQNSNSNQPPHSPPKNVSLNSDIRDIGTSIHSLNHNTRNSPVLFELPPQFSSSEESSSSDEASVGKGEISPHRDNQSHYAQHISSKTDRQLFEAAFDSHNTTCEKNLDDSTPRHWHNGDTRKDKALSSGAILNEDWQGQSLQHALHRHQNVDQQQPYIDLVDSDGDQEVPFETSLNGPLCGQNNHKGQHHCGTSRIFENEGSQRSPFRRSPKFNVLSRSIIHNNQWTNSNRSRQLEEDDDVAQFDDDENRLSTRLRRVTQDHATYITRNMDNSSGNNINERSPVPEYLQQVPEHQRQQLSQEASNHPPGRSIPRPWHSRTTRKMRDPTSSNVSLAASVKVKDTTRYGRNSSGLTNPDTISINEKQISRRSTDEHVRNVSDNGDIRTFFSRRPSLANETRKRVRSLEAVRTNRHDIQGHSAITVVNHPSFPTTVTGRRVRSLSRQRPQEEVDVIEVFEDEEENLPPSQPARGSRASASAAAKVAKPKAKPKRKRTYTKRTKSRKGGGRKRSRKPSSSKGRSQRGGGRFARRGGNRTTNNSDSGAWGCTDSGWTSQRPVHREDPAFHNIGAEITF